MAKSFNIKYDSSQKSWRPTQMRVRMMENCEDGYQPCSFTDVEFVAEPSDWLSFSPQPDGEIVCADVCVTEAFIAASPDQKFASPIKVVVKARPEGASYELKPISVDCQVQVEEPGQNLGFTVSPDECYKDGSVMLPADGKTLCNLTVWVEEVDPESGQVYRAPEEDFDFKVETTFDPKLLLCLDIKKGIIPAESRWRTAKALTDLEEPLRGEVTVKAFSKKGNGNRPVGKIDIPWALFASEIAFEKTFVPELPAWPGREVVANLRLIQKGQDAPVADTLVQFVWADSCKSSPLGKIASLSGRTDGNGMVELRYEPPEELVYMPKKRFFDEIAILVGEGENPAQLKETVVIPVAPQIDLVASAEKKGLVLDPEQQPVQILPQFVTGGNINGNLILEIQMEGGPLKQFGVCDARMSMGFSEDNPSALKLETLRRGAWKLKLNEIEEAFKKAGLQSKPVKLSLKPEDKQTFKMVLDQEAEDIIRNYENGLDESNMAIFSAKFQRSLKYYRYHFATQLAEKLEKNYDLAVSGVNLLLVAIKGSRAYLRYFKSHNDMVKSRFDKLFSTMISVALNALSASSNLRQAPAILKQKAAELIEGMAQYRLGRWILKGASWFGDFVGSLGEKAMNKIAPMVKYMADAIKNFFGKLGESGHKLYSGVASLLDDFVRVVDDLCIALKDKVSAFNQKLSASGSRWNELVEWAQKKKDAAGKAIDSASDFVSEFLKSFQEVAEAVLNLVGHMFEKLGDFLYKCLTGIFSWCIEKAHKLIETGLNWLSKHCPKSKETVEEILNATMDNVGAVHNGIEKIIDSVMNEIVNLLISCKPAEGAKDVALQSAKKKLGLMDRQPTHVVGEVYRCATKQLLSRDWEREKREFSQAIVDSFSEYSSYEQTTNTVDEVADIVNIIISVGGLGVTLLGIVFSGGTGIAVIAAAVAKFEACFNIAKAVVFDAPQVAYAIRLMFELVAKYDLIVCDLCFANPAGVSA